MQFSVDNTPSSDMQKRLQKLRKNFIAGIPKRLQDMDMAPSVTVRIQVLHQLAGAALSFRTEALGNLARSTEVDLEKGLVTDWPASLAALRVEFRRLESEVD